MRKHAKTNIQISCSVTMQLICDIVQFLFFLNPKFLKPLAIFCGCTVGFVYDMVPKDRFSHTMVYIQEVVEVVSTTWIC